MAPFRPTPHNPSSPQAVHKKNVTISAAVYSACAVIIAGWVMTLVSTKGTCMPDKTLMEGYTEQEDEKEEKSLAISDLPPGARPPAASQV